MLPEPRGFFATALPAAALLSLVCGPSPSAARADYQARLPRDRPSKQVLPPAARRNAPCPRQPFKEADHPSKPPESKDDQDQQSLLASFVAPTAAKPAETDSSGSQLAAGQAAAAVFALHVVPPSRVLPARNFPRPLHRPAFQANAPPSR